MDAMRIPAKRRTEVGKGVARGLRRDGEIPAVVYGRGEEPISLAVSPKELLHVFGGEYGRNTVIELDVEGSGQVTVLLREYQYHPVTRHLLHADFIRIDTDEPVMVDVPFELTGKAPGVTLGGTLRKVFRELPVSCLPASIPVRIEHDTSEMGLDAHVAVSELSLPEGVSVRLPANQTVCAVIAEKKAAAAAQDEDQAEEGAGAAASS